MIRTGIIGRGTPQLVHACTVRNDSRDNVYVRILYEPVRDQKDELHERRVEFQLGRGKQTQINEEEFNMGSYTIREAIRTIEVTRSNGQTQEINAPFENVTGIELDWLFIVEDRNIRSINPNSR